MKLISTSLILFLTLYEVTNADSGNQIKGCPPSMKPSAQVKKCVCYEQSRYMVCSKIDSEWIKNFKPDHSYELDTLVINDSPDLELLSEHFHSFSGDTVNFKGFTIKSLILNLASDPKFSNDVLDQLVSLPTEKLEIKITVPTTLKISADLFKPSLTSISLSNLQLTNFKEDFMHKFVHVQSLFLDTVKFDKDMSMIISQPTALTRIEIINSPSLVSFQYIPLNCGDDQIVLNLQRNLKLAEFKMDNLFDESKCNYHIDLSGSTLKPDFLTTNHNFISKSGDGKLFMILRDVPNLVCKQKTWLWYVDKTHRAYLHSVECKGKKDPAKYLDQFTKKEEFDEN